MFNKTNLSRFLLLLIAFSFVITIIGSRGCPKRDRNRIGSSNGIFRVNDPSGLTAQVVELAQINLTWIDNSNNEDGFKIERKIAGGIYTQIATVGVDTISYLDLGPFSFNTYYYRVRAYMGGDNSGYSNEAWTPISPPAWSAVTVGAWHTIALTGSNRIWGWGLDIPGQVGLGYDSPITVTTPTLVGTDADWAIIGTGYSYTFAIKTNRTLWGWGANESGQLGLGDSDDRIEPTPVGSDLDWSKITGGSNHSLGLKTNGTIWSWGYNSFGQLGLGYYGDPNDPTNPLNYVLTPTQIGIGSDWSSIAAGSAFCFGIKNNGTLWSWGWNRFGQLGLGFSDIFTSTRTTPSQIGTGSDWVSVAAGYNYAIGLKANRTLWAWGANRNGELGDGTTDIRNTPRQIGIDSDWSVIAAGGYVITSTSFINHSLALKTNGTLWSWGNNQYGQLGVGDPNNGNRYIPTQIGTDSNWVRVAAKCYHSIAIANNGTIWVWGGNEYYQLGLGDTINRNIPCTIGSPAPPSLLSSNMILSQIALSWVDNANNETGFKIERKLNRTGTYQQIATVGSGIISWSDTGPFSAGTYYYYRIKAYNNAGDSSYSNETWMAVSGNWSYNRNGIAAGLYHTIARKANGTLWAWGWNPDGQLGLDGTNINSPTPTQIGNDTTWSLVTTGASHTIACKTNRALWAWGSNNFGQLGDGSTDDRTTPRQIGSSTDWYLIATGGSHTITLKRDGTLWAWGYNMYGQLGDGSTDNRTTPRQIGSNTNWSLVVAGGTHTIACKTNGTLWAWGYNMYGQLGDGSTDNRTTPRQIGSGTDWSSFAAGLSHTIACKTNRTLWSWGDNEYNQLGDGTTVNRTTPRQIGIDSDWISVAAGGKGLSGAHTLGLKTNGTLWAWGSNNYGQLGDGSMSNRTTPRQIGSGTDWSSFAAGASHTIACKTNRTLWAWGWNPYGQLGLGDSGTGTDRNIPTLVGE